MGKHLPTILFVMQLIGFIVAGTYGYANVTAAVAQNTELADKNQRTLESMTRVNVVIHSGIREEIRTNERTSNGQAVAIGRVQVGIESIQETLKLLRQDLRLR